MKTKTCTKCGRELLLSEFSKCARRNETHYSQCRDCKAEYRRENKDRLLQTQYQRRANQTECDKAKRKAWNIVYYRLRTGKITKPEKCEICGSSRNIQAHHKDYSKPLEITWVCQVCHAELDDIRRCG